MASDIFSQRLKKARKDANLSKAELSRISGINVATISAYEYGRDKGRSPTLNKAAKLAKALNVPLDWLCGSLEDYSNTQITDILKMFVKLSEYVDVSIDTADLKDENISNMFPDAANHFADKDKSDYTEYGIKTAKKNNPVCFIGVKNSDIRNFLCEWAKVKELYDKTAINKNVYELWLTKSFQSFGKTQTDTEKI